MKKLNCYIKVLSFLIIFSFTFILQLFAIGIKVLNSSEEGIVFTVNEIHFKFEYVTIEDKIYKKIIIPGEPNVGYPGEPELPFISRLFGVPYNKSAEIEILDSEFYTVDNEEISPIPEIERIKNGDVENLKYNYFFDKNIYSSDNFFPISLTEISDEGIIRKQNVCAIKIYPIQYNPVKKVLKIYKQMKLLIKFSENKSLKKESERKIVNVRYFDTFRNFINYDNIVKWNSKNISELGKKVTANNFVDSLTISNFKYKMEVEDDGLYKLQGDYLIAEGIDISKIDPKSIKIFNKGDEIPIYVSTEEDGIFDASDYIIFYGTRNRGGEDFFDPYTDRNVYWLTWDGKNGRRFEEYNDSIKSGNVVNFFKENLHNELDVFYSGGDTDEEIRITAKVPGEGWYWTSFEPGRIRNFNVYVYGLKQEGDSSKTRIKFRGITSGNHRLNLKINEIDVGNVQFNGRTDYIVEFAVNKGILKEGQNLFSITSVIPSGELDMVYLDWIDVEYYRSYSVFNDKLTFSLSENKGTRYVLTGFEKSDVEIIDITNKVRIKNFLTNSEGNLYNITFEDNRSGDKREYCAASSSKGFLLPANMKKVSFSDLKNPSNSADYVIIAYEKFLESANSLAEFRRNKHSFLTKVVNVEHIYDEFNYGIASPVAIKEFIKFTYNNWATVPSFIVMFGDASWDYKKKGYVSIFETFVPSYDYPASDNWFVSLDGEEDILPDMYLGRIPVATEEQAENYVQKVMDYESAVNNLWNKRILLINGGLNEYEQNLFHENTRYVVNNITSPPPSGMKDIIINKTSTDMIDFSFRDEIIKIIDDGVLMINSAGHAALQTYDVDFGKASDLNNYKKYPFMLSMSCNTAQFADPSVFTLSEDYLLANDKGAIGYFGTTGWGYIQLDNILQQWIFSRAFIDTVRMLGIMSTDSKYHLWQVMGSKFRQETINTINQYTFMGDPCIGLALPKKTDPTVVSENIKFSNDFPNEMDGRININVMINNYGLYLPDSVRVSIYDDYEGVGIFPIKENIVVKPFGIQDSISVNWEIVGKKGNHQIIVEIDPKNLIIEENEENNKAIKSITVFSSDVTLLKPQMFTRINTNNVKLEVFCNSTEKTYQRTLYFGVDTTENFGSPFYTTYGPITEGLLTTTVQVDLPFDKIYYYWRVRSFDGTNYSRWANSIFHSDFSADSGFVWFQEGKAFKEDIFENLRINDNVSLASHIIELYSESAGYKDGNLAILKIDNNIIDVAEYDSLFPIDFYNQGFYVAVMDERTGRLISALHFNTHMSSKHSEAMADFINNVDANKKIMCAVVSDGSSNLTQSLKKAIKSIGSDLIDNLSFQDSYAIIGRKGAAIGSVPEQHKKSGTGRAIIEDSISINFLNGNLISNFFDGFKNLKSFKYTGEAVGNGVQLKVGMLAFNKKTLTWDTLYKNIPNDVEFDLSNTNSKIYSKLKLYAQFSDDDGLDTPSLSKWSLRYEPACDLITNFKFISIDKDSILEGQNVKVSANIYNIGYDDADSIFVRFYALTEDRKSKIGEDVLISQIGQNEFKSVENVFNTSGYIGNVKILVEIDPDNIINELSDLNNSAIINLFIRKDNIAPSIDVTFDGQALVSGDYISKNPEILIKIRDNNPSGIKDTSNVKIYLDNKKISFYNYSSIQFILHPNGGEIIAEVIYSPTLEDGEHTFKVVVTDVGQNSYFYETRFSVSSQLEIKNVYNFPNPLNKDTYFTYILTKEVEEVSIRIFTVSGRLVKILSDISNRAGYNQVYWDGKDEDGDNLANGVYFYKIIAKNENEQFSVMQKCAISR
jgi:hypothetical protein